MTHLLVVAVAAAAGAWYLLPVFVHPSQILVIYFADWVFQAQVAIHLHGIGVIEPATMHSFQPTGPIRVSLEVIIPSQGGITPEQWKQTATLCLDWPTNYSLLRLWHHPTKLHQFADLCTSNWTTATCLRTGHWTKKADLRRNAATEEQLTPVSFALENSWTKTSQDDKTFYRHGVIFPPFPLLLFSCFLGRVSFLSRVCFLFSYGAVVPWCFLLASCLVVCGLVALSFSRIQRDLSSVGHLVATARSGRLACNGLASGRRYCMMSVRCAVLCCYWLV